MVEIRNDAGDRFAARPDPAVRLVLFYGPDAGLVAERAARFAAAAGGGGAMAVRLDSDAIATSPGLLLEEAHGLSLFAERTVIRLRVPASFNPAILAPLVDDPPNSSFVVLEAGDLRKTAPLRRLFEAAPVAAAVACYPDDERTLGRLIDEEMATAGLAVAPEARRLLIGQLGADRLVTRRELAKLALHGHGTATVSETDVRAVVGDAADAEAEGAVAAAAEGDLAGLDAVLRRLAAAGTHPTIVAGAALRHFQALQRARAAVDGGQTVAAAAERLRPPLYGPRRAAAERQIRLWGAAGTAWAAALLFRVMADGRLHPPLESAAVSGALMQIGAVARRLRERG